MVAIFDSVSSGAGAGVGGLGGVDLGLVLFYCDLKGLWNYVKVARFATTC